MESKTITIINNFECLGLSKSESLKLFEAINEYCNHCDNDILCYMSLDDIVVKIIDGYRVHDTTIDVICEKLQKLKNKNIFLER